jgi:protein-tyrosine phosphatase
MISILFVCMANICRSPSGEAMLRYIVEKEGVADKFHIASCGVSGWCKGQNPDKLMAAAAAKRGIILSGRSQPFNTLFYDQFDYILASDKKVLSLLLYHASTPAQKEKVVLMTEYSLRSQKQDIPDPYNGGEEAFDDVLDMLEDSCLGLLRHVQGL